MLQVLSAARRRQTVCLGVGFEVSVASLAGVGALEVSWELFAELVVVLLVPVSVEEVLLLFLVVLSGGFPQPYL